MGGRLERWRDDFLHLATGGGTAPPLMRTTVALSQLLQRGNVWHGWEQSLCELEAAAVRRCHGAGPADEAQATGALFDLLREHGYAGNVTDYERVENSFMDRVLQDRVGIPISLSVLAIHLGEIVDLPIQGVGFPGHFIVGVGLQSRTPAIFDPFNGGVRLSFEDLAALYRAATGKRMTSHAPLLRLALEPASSAAILSRILRNLQRQYALRGAQDRAAEVVGLLAALHPEQATLPSLQRQLARRLATLN